MNKEEIKIFKEYCYSYANRFLSCVCANTEEKYLHTFAKFRYWRIIDELEDKKNIIIKNTDTDAYKIYEGIMIEVLSKKIEEDKIAASKKAREKAKAEKEKKKKGKRD